MNNIFEQLKKSDTRNFNAVDTTTNRIVRCVFENEDKTSIFVYAKNKKRRGWRYTEDTFLSLYEPLPNSDEEKAWKRRLKRAVKLCRESGLWSALTEVWGNLYNYVPLDEKKKLNDMNWNNREDAIAYCRERYPFMLAKRDDGSEYIDTDYIWELSECKLKSMYFGYNNAEEKENIKNAIAERRKYTVPRIRTGYDVSFDYDPDKGKAWYSEEYKDCGNGHYYLALNHSTAVFCEDD